MNKISKMKDSAVTLYYYDNRPTHVDTELWWGGYGWYFTDETDNFIGPYDTEHECINALNKYIAYLGSEQYSYAGE